MPSKIWSLLSERADSTTDHHAGAEFYAGVGLELRTDPDDYSLYAQVDLTGFDPNGIGLMGYDNTPGKDSGNERLYDRIGAYMPLHKKTVILDTVAYLSNHFSVSQPNRRPALKRILAQALFSTRSSIHSDRRQVSRQILLKYLHLSQFTPTMFVALLA